METRHDETVHSQAIVELTEANLTPTEHTPEWADEVASLRLNSPAESPPPPPPIVQEFADVLAMEG